MASQPRDGYRMLMQTSGLGGMQINTVVIPWMNVRDLLSCVMLIVGAEVCKLVFI